MDTPGRIAELERKFAENPRRYFAALANEFRKQGDLARAIELCEAHLAEQRNHLSGHVVLAQALVDAGRESDAWDPLHTALDLDPENFIALRLIGELFARVGDVDHARTYFFRALEIEPRNEDLLASVKNLSQRSVTPEPIRAEQSKPSDAQVTAPASWGDVTPLQGLDSTIAFDAEAAAEPVAEEVGTTNGESQAEPGGEPAPEGAVEAQPEATGPAQPAATGPAQAEAAGELLSEELPLPEPLETAWGELPVETPPAQTGATGGAPTERPAESAGAQPPDSAFPDWVPVDGGAAEPTPGEDWVSAAGPVPTEGADDWDVVPETDEPKPTPAERYDYHDWLPSLPADTERGDADAPGEGAAEQEGEPDQPSEAAAAAESAGPTETAEPGAPSGPPEFLEPASDEPRTALASETMADLYLQQGHASLAIDVLRELAGARPDDERLRARLVELEIQSAAPPRQTVRDMFARFARTSQQLRERAHQGSVPSGVGGDEPRDAGPLADFFAGAPGPVRGSRTPPDALLAMLTPRDEASTDEGALGDWLGTLRGS